MKNPCVYKLYFTGHEVLIYVVLAFMLTIVVDCIIIHIDYKLQ